MVTNRMAEPKDELMITTGKDVCPRKEMSANKFRELFIFLIKE